jgi:predicted nucleic-acid-binding Zn-ribbon protein
MDSADRAKFSQALEDRSVTQPCPRCGNHRFSVLGMSNLKVVGGGAGLLSAFLERDVPTVVVVCNNCGFLSNHAAAVLSGEVGGGR